MRASRGFTLVELITVIVVLSIVAAIGSGFVVTAVDSYRDTQERAQLVQKGRLAIEQMTRQLRIALPHSVRVSASGTCVEFMPIVAGGNYLTPVPNAASGATDGIQTLNTSHINFSELGGDDPTYVVIGALCDTEIYAGGTCGPSGGSARAAYQGYSEDDSSSTYQVTLTGAHVFVRNSINKRLFITDNPKRFCVDGGDLVEYSDYGVLPAIEDGEVGDETLIVSGVSSASGPLFALSDGSEDRNTAVHINLQFSQGGSAVTLNHQVLVRNVP